MAATTERHNMTDPRIRDLIRFQDPDPQSPPRVIGVWPGAKEGTLHGVALITKGAIDQYLSTVFDVRSNRHYGPAEAGRRIREAAGPVLGRLNEQAVKLRDQGAIIQGQLREASTTPRYDKTGYWQPQFDLRIVDTYNATPIGEKAGIRHQLLRDPLQHLDIADALQRVPLTISKLTWEERNAIRVALFRQMRPDEFAALDMAREQYRIAHATTREAVAAIRDTTGTNADLLTHARDAFDMAKDGEPVSWGPMPADLDA